MKFKTVLLLVVAVGCGLVAMLGVQQALSGDGPAEEEQVQVLVATADIMPGVPVDDTNTMFKNWPKESVPAGSVTKPEEYEERAALVRMFPGETVLQAKLGEPGVYGASTEIPDGMRVVSVPVNLTKTHSGQIMPGDRVDVLVTYKVRRSGTGMVTKVKTVLEYIKVFATDALRSSSVGGAETAEIQAKNISLLVTPEQGNLLMLAESKGQLTLALRRIDDDEKGNAPAITDAEFDEEQTSYGVTADEDADREEGGSDVRELLEEETSEDPAPAEETVAEVVEPEKPTWKVTIYSGDEVRVEEVDLPEEPAPITAEGAESDAKRAGLKGFLQRFFTGA